MISHIYFKAKLGPKWRVENGPLFFWEQNEWFIQSKDLAWAQFLEL